MVFITRNQTQSVCAAAVAATLFLTTGSINAGPPSPAFFGLGDLPGGTTYSTAMDVSADGQTIVGESRSALGLEGFRWTFEGGMQGLNFAGVAYGVNADGSVLAGTASGFDAFRWTIDGGRENLGGIFDNHAWGVSADGSAVIGFHELSNGSYEGVRWTAENGEEGLGDLPGGDFHSWAYSANHDGSVVVGGSRSGFSGCCGLKAFRWTPADGMEGLGDLPGGGFNSNALAVSSDGSVIVGVGTSTSGREAFRWTAEGRDGTPRRPSRGNL